MAAPRADDLLAEGHAALGWQEFWFGWNWPAAERSLRRAVALDPNYANARRSLGHMLSNSGRHSEALAEMARARALDPFSPLMHVLSAQTAYNARDFAAAERHARQSIVIDPNFWGGYVNLGQALAGQARFEDALIAIAEGYRLAGNAKGLTRRGYVLGRMGRTAEAQQLLRELEQPAGGVPPYEIAAVYAGLGDAERAFVWLEKAYTARDVNLVFLPVDPKMDRVRPDPRGRWRAGLPAETTSTSRTWPRVTRRGVTMSTDAAAMVYFRGRVLSEASSRWLARQFKPHL